MKLNSVCFILQSLVNWNALNAKSLLWATEELLEEYSKYQRSLISTSSRLQFEYSSLVETHYECTDIEVHVTMKNQVSLQKRKNFCRL